MFASRPTPTPPESAPDDASVIVPTSQNRLLDTRNGTGTGGRIAKIGAGQWIKLQFAGVNGVPAAGTAAAELNITVTGDTAAGFISAYPDGTTRPTASSVNFQAGQTVANASLMPVGPDGAIDFYNGSGAPTSSSTPRATTTPTRRRCRRRSRYGRRWAAHATAQPQDRRHRACPAAAPHPDPEDPAPVTPAQGGNPSSASRPHVLGDTRGPGQAGPGRGRRQACDHRTGDAWGSGGAAVGARRAYV